MKPQALRAPLALFGRAHEAGLHAIAIGGIDAGNAGRVAAVGAEAVAVISSVFGEPGSPPDETTIETNARRISEAFEAGVKQPASRDLKYCH